MNQEKKALLAGNLVLINNISTTGGSLGLVVNQVRGKVWADRDPCLDHLPSINDKESYLIVRVLGLRTVGCSSIGKTVLPKEEPDEAMTVRWSYVQENRTMHIAGPDMKSINNFLEQCYVCDSLGMRGSTFFHDVELLVEYLDGVTRTRNAMGHSEHKFFKMLEDVLPKLKAKEFLYHDNSPCSTELDETSFCKTCNTKPDTISVKICCPVCNIPLKFNNGLTCNQCKQIFDGVEKLNS